jgi:adenosylcobinamide-GDP ribazoletransferase
VEEIKVKEHTSQLMAFLAAVQFLLVSPAFVRRVFTPRELGRSVAFFPLVGLLLGLILTGLEAEFSLFLPPLVRASLLLAVWVVLTGALHLDGFLDACDGLLGGFDPERRLEIMRDERVGAYALAGGALLLLVKFSALASLEQGMPALLLAPVLGRWAMALGITSFPYARPQGLGREIKDHSGWRQAAAATAFTLLVVVVLIILGERTLPILLAAGAAAFTAWLVIRFSLGRLPGLTGDIYGAVNEMVETAVLIVLAAA